MLIDHATYHFFGLDNSFWRKRSIYVTYVMNIVKPLDMFKY